MNQYNIEPPTGGSELIAGRSPDDPALKDPALFPVWTSSDIARIYAYERRWITQIVAEGKLETYTGHHTRYIFTHSMNAYVAKFGRGR